VDFNQAPILIFWETTRACELACRHCRAEARAEPFPGELSTDEGAALIDRLAGFRPRRPVLILTGGDVMMRRDLPELVARAQQAKLPVAVAPSVTPRLDDAGLMRLRELGISSISISLDGADAATHEGVRGVPGHFQQTLDTMRRISALGFKLQVNTAVMRSNAAQLAEIAAIVGEVGAIAGEVFFLVKVGRGRAQEELSAQENEDVAHFLYEASSYKFAVRTVEGPWCRRVAAWREELAADADPATTFSLGPLYRHLSRELAALMGPAPSKPHLASSGTRDGSGIFFIAHDGTAYPAGFLPFALANVRDEDPVAIYREHPLLAAIRAARFSGRCGRCEFREACGGSRSRAYAASGDPLGEDPACAYVPA